MQVDEEIIYKMIARFFNDINFNQHNNLGEYMDNFTETVSFKCTPKMEMQLKLITSLSHGSSISDYMRQMAQAAIDKKEHELSVLQAAFNTRNP